MSATGGLIIGRLVVYKALDEMTPRESWTPVMQEDVPPDIKAPAVLGRIKAGELAQTVADDGDDHFYRAEMVSEKR